MSARERLSITLPPSLVERLEFARRETSKLTGCKLSQSQIVEAVLERALPQLPESDK